MNKRGFVRRYSRYTKIDIEIMRILKIDKK